MKEFIKKYGTTGLKVLGMQLLAGLVWLAIIYFAIKWFGDPRTYTMEHPLSPILFITLFLIGFLIYLVLKGYIAQKLFKWK